MTAIPAMHCSLFDSDLAVAPCYVVLQATLGLSSTSTILKEKKLQGIQAEVKLGIPKQMFKFENINMFITMTKVLHSPSKV